MDRKENNQTEKTKKVKQDEFEGIMSFRSLDEQGKIFFLNMMKYLSKDRNEIRIVKTNKQ